MTVMANQGGLRLALLGNKVDRAAAALPAAATPQALFTIAGGRVLLTQIVGEVTTVIQTQANNTKLTSNPTTGADLDVCAVLDISADAVGTLYSITGTLADALAGAGPGAVPGMAKPIVLPVGTLDLNCAATNTGAVKWTAFWVAIDDGATVVAA